MKRNKNEKNDQIKERSLTDYFGDVLCNLFFVCIAAVFWFFICFIYLFITKPTKKATSIHTLLSAYGSKRMLTVYTYFIYLLSFVYFHLVSSSPKFIILYFLRFGFVVVRSERACWLLVEWLNMDFTWILCLGFIIVLNSFQHVWTVTEHIVCNAHVCVSVWWLTNVSAFCWLHLFWGSQSKSEISREIFLINFSLQKNHWQLLKRLSRYKEGAMPKGKQITIARIEISIDKSEYMNVAE